MLVRSATIFADGNLSPPTRVPVAAQISHLFTMTSSRGSRCRLAATIVLCVLGTFPYGGVIGAPVIPVQSAEHFRALTENEKSLTLVLFHAASWSKQSKLAKENFDDLAANWEAQPNPNNASDEVDEPIFVLVDAGVHKGIARAEKIHRLPALRGYVYHYGAHDYASGQYTVDTMRDFALRWTVHHAATVESIRRREEEQRRRIPTNVPHPSLGSVVELTANNFLLLTGDPAKTVFVLFYASWCGHCKEVIPAMDELAEYFEQDRNVLIGKIDITKEADTVSKFGITGVPALKLFPKGTHHKDAGMDYGERRDYGHMKNFVDRHAGMSLPRNHLPPGHPVNIDRQGHIP